MVLKAVVNGEETEKGTGAGLKLLAVSAKPQKLDKLLETTK